MFALCGYVLAQGIGSLRAHHFAYWNVRRNLVLYPEIQITFGAIGMLLAILPMQQIVDRLTEPYLRNRHPHLKSFWKRRHQRLDNLE